MVTTRGPGRLVAPALLAGRLSVPAVMKLNEGRGDSAGEGCALEMAERQQEVNGAAGD